MNLSEGKATEGIDKKGMSQVLFCYVLWGLLPIFWKQLAELNPFYVLSSRILWSTIFCFVVVLCGKHFEELKQILANQQQMKLLAYASVMIAVNWGAYIYAVSAGHILDASLGYYLNPLLSVALGFLVFRETILKTQWVAIGIAAAGIAVAILWNGTVPYFALIMSSSFSAYAAIKKNVTCSGLISTLIEALLLTPFAIVYIILSEQSGAGAIGVMSGAQLLLFPAMGMVTSIPLLAFASGIKRIPLSLSGMLMYINPTLQLLLGVVLYKEDFDISRMIMFVCVWAALIVFVTSGKQKQPISEQAAKLS